MKLPDDEDRDRAGDRRLARFRHQGQLRHDGEAAARRPLQRATASSPRSSRATGSRRTRARSSTSRASSTSSTAPGNYDAAKILPAWAEPLDIVSPGIAVKQYPCCGSTHSALDAALKLAREHKPARRRHRAHRRLDARPAARAHQPARSARATSTPSSACSTAWPARSSTAPSPSSISRATPTRDPAVRKLLAARACRALHHGAVSRGEPLRRGGASVALRGGKVLSGKGGPAVRPDFGRIPCPPRSSRRSSTTARGAPCRPSASGALYSAIQGFENLKDAREMTAIIAGEGRQARAAAA